MRRRAQGDGFETGARKQAHSAGRRDRQDQSERPRPEGAGEFFGVGAEDGVLARGLKVENMGDERVDRRPLLGGVDRRDRRIRGRVGGQAVNRLGRHGDEAARA